MTKYDHVVELLKNHWVTVLILFSLIAIMSLPQIKNGLSLVYSWTKSVFQRKDSIDDNAPIVFEMSGEKVTFTELLRTVKHEVIKMNAHTHALGVKAEYKWIRQKYPKSKTIKQSLTTFKMITNQKQSKYDQIYFDIIKIMLPNGIEKEIYFDISSFFGGGVSSAINPKEFIAKKIADLYK